MPELVKLPVGNLHDIPALLEALAREIQDGQHGTVISGAGVFVDEQGSVFVCGWGRTDDIHSIGLLQLGSAWLASHKVER